MEGTGTQMPVTFIGSDEILLQSGRVIAAGAKVMRLAAERGLSVEALIQEIGPAGSV